ncbi:alpha-L-arabinofuranosidase C-terminus-domain-containing protein [Mycena albidolilacea]|uniref:Alpha-L-arabinofuranosidase C-terminus-domain-containing protein n=1 Tax=Mycena albidolilacea TaxID=1033008 RepID=A0AAD6ZXU7_9AGAR|nr:alpha-L-arabinofuranosidase C-terminus-domain-containing protein [Mycena albidolilacea]
MLRRVERLGSPGEKGAKEHYHLSDALVVASWLNVFVRKADVVKIACIALSVNGISPIITSPTGLFKQTTYYPIQLFARLMQGTALSLRVTFNNNKYTNPTVPAFVASLTAHTRPASRLTKWIDVSHILSPNTTQVRLAIVNRHQTRAYSVPKGAGKVVVHQSADLRDRNAFAEGEKVKSVKTAMDDWKGVHEVKHSFQVLAFTLVHFRAQKFPRTRVKSRRLWEWLKDGYR